MRQSGLMRPSKLRLPLSTEATTRSCSSTVREISGARGPELPMQVVQPKPTRWKPSSPSYGSSPALPLAGPGDPGGRGAGVADAGGAAEADQVEAELLEVRQQPGPLVVVHDHLGPGGAGGRRPRPETTAAARV